MDTKAPDATNALPIEAAMPWLDAHNYLKKKEKKRERKFCGVLALKNHAHEWGHNSRACFLAEPQRCSQPGQAFESPKLPLVA